MTDFERRTTQSGWFRNETTGLAQTLVLGLLLAAGIQSIIESQGYTMQGLAESLGFTDTERTVTESVVDSTTTSQVESVGLSQEAQIAILLGASTTLAIFMRYFVGYAITKFSSLKK